jgi:hypothetical protein
VHEKENKRCQTAIVTHQHVALHYFDLIPGSWHVMHSLLVNDFVSFVGTASLFSKATLFIRRGKKTNIIIIHRIFEIMLKIFLLFFGYQKKGISFHFLLTVSVRMCIYRLSFAHSHSVEYLNSCTGHLTS